MTSIERTTVEKALATASSAISSEALMRVANLSEEDMAAGLASTRGLRDLYEGRAKDLLRRGAPEGPDFAAVADALATVEDASVVSVRIPVEAGQTSDLPFYSVLLTGDSHDFVACTYRQGPASQ